MPTAVIAVAVMINTTARDVIRILVLARRSQKCYSLGYCDSGSIENEIVS